MNVGEKIRFYRKKNGLTQKQLANLCGIAEPNLRKYELGKQNPKLGTMKKISAALDMKITDLLADEFNFSEKEVSTSTFFSKKKAIVGMNIKAARKKKKLKQKELAEIIGYTESSISKYEQGLIQIPNTVIDLIAKALDVSPLELLPIDGEFVIDLSMVPTNDLLDEIKRRCS